MHFHTTSGELSLKLLHATPSQSASHPDMHVEISATVGAYSVQGVKVWLEWPEIEAFILDLTVLVRELKGEAKLIAMSREDFQLELSNLDELGHFGLNFTVGSQYLAGNGHFKCGLQAGFEVELSDLELSLQWFDAVICSEV
ncbi:hypothetical protein [Aeromonas veronii]|uniref:hypothetical protein n=1 Tax=Aeromonas veronii TaxID=654 RepID=UPI001302CBFC|nr:hypothetical protein [Aeromonas veronii]KAE9635977.1 hypothetical protein GO977_08855 [Aeromonas veronii]